MARKYTRTGYAHSDSISNGPYAIPEMNGFKRIDPDNESELLPFYVKNIGNTNVQLTIIPAASDTETTTVFYPGWNVELIKEIKGVVPANLQWGE